MPARFFVLIKKRETMSNIEWKSEKRLLKDLKASRITTQYIVPFNQDQLLFLEVSNAITLCDKHHNQTKYKEHLYINIFNEVLNAN